MPRAETIGAPAFTDAEPSASIWRSFPNTVVRLDSETRWPVTVSWVRLGIGPSSGEDGAHAGSFRSLEHLALSWKVRGLGLVPLSPLLRAAGLARSPSPYRPFLARGGRFTGLVESPRSLTFCWTASGVRPKCRLSTRVGAF